MIQLKERVATLYKALYTYYINERENFMFKIDDFLMITKAAKFLGVTPTTLRNWEKEKKITTYRNPINSYRLYKKEDLEELLNKIKIGKNQCV